MKQIFFTLALVGLASCSNGDKHDHVVEIMGTQHSYTQDTQDSIPTVQFADHDINDFTTVNQLLDHLETLPAE